VQSTVDEIDKLYGKCSKGKSLALALVVDVTSENQVKLSIQRGIEEFGKISILINCAGIAPPM
jgi:NAD(P)-dependent dehydrogenase (short-subunit alcohol dehydrogenase family)